MNLQTGLQIGTTVTLPTYDNFAPVGLSANGTRAAVIANDGDGGLVAFIDPATGTQVAKLQL